MWSLVVEPFLEFEFLRRALVEAFILSLTFPVIGLVLITRRLSLIGDALSHAMLPGVVIAFVFAGPSFAALFTGGWITSFVLLSLAAWMARRRLAEVDAVLALFAVFAVALGVLIASHTRTTTEILHLLFGNILSVDESLLAASALIGAMTWSLFLVGYRSYVAALVDPALFAGVRGLRPLLMAALLAIFSANLTVGFAGLGAMMTVGLLIVPALVGRRFGGSPLGMVLIAALFAVVVSAIGVLLSFHGDVPSGPAIVVVACVGLAFAQLIPGRERRHR